MISKILVDNWDSNNRIGRSMSFIKSGGYVNDNPYLFHKRELGVTQGEWKDARNKGVIRHCKVLYNGKFFDYIVGREYDTLHDWMLEIGATLDDLCYGTNRVHKNKRVWDTMWSHARWEPHVAVYVPLREVLTRLGYKEPPPVEVKVPAATQDLTEMVNLELRMYGLTIDNVYILDGGAIVKWNDFMRK